MGDWSRVWQIAVDVNELLGLPPEAPEAEKEISEEPEHPEEPASDPP